MRKLFPIVLSILFVFIASIKFFSKPAEFISVADSSIGQNDKKKSAPDDTLQLGTTLVTTNVLVADRSNRYLTNLNQKDFHIYENGVEQKISFFSSTEEPFSAVMTLDISGSAVRYLKDEQEAAVAFVKQIHPADRVALVSFDTNANVLLPKWTNDQAVLCDAILKIKVKGGTSLLKTLGGVTDLLKHTKGRKALILLTDGDDNVGGDSAIRIVKELQEIDALFYVIQYSSGVHYRSKSTDTLSDLSSVEKPLLEQLTEGSGGRLYTAKIGATKDTMASIIEDLRNQYTVGYYPTASTKPGKEIKLKVKVDRPNVSVRSRRSYVAN